jgi:hypothetical protein
LYTPADQRERSTVVRARLAHPLGDHEFEVDSTVDLNELPVGAQGIEELAKIQRGTV